MKLIKKIDKVGSMLLLFSFCNVITFASDGGFSTDEIVNNINSGGGVYEIIKQIIGALSFLGAAIALFKMMQIGMMFMSRAASSKIEAKTAIFPWLVGLFVCATFGVIGPAIIDLILSGSSGGVFDI